MVNWIIICRSAQQEASSGQARADSSGLVMFRWRVVGDLEEESKEERRQESWESRQARASPSACRRRSRLR